MFNPVPTCILDESLYAVRTGGLVNFFLHAADGSLVAFDAGFSAGAVLREMRRIGLDPAAVTHLFLTHSDADHTGGAAAFPHAALYLPAEEERMIDGTTPRGFGRHNKGLPRPYSLLRAGQIVTIGRTEVLAIATPGHTPGSMSYLVDGAVLLAGDTLVLSRGRARRFFIGMDRKTQKESIRKLAALRGVSWLCTCHGGCTREFDQAMAAWR